MTTHPLEAVADSVRIELRLCGTIFEQMCLAVGRVRLETVTRSSGRKSPCRCYTGSGE